MIKRALVGATALAAAGALAAAEPMTMAAAGANAQPAVSYMDPPPDAPLTPITSVDVAGNMGVASVASAPGGAIVMTIEGSAETYSAFYAGVDGSRSPEVALPVPLSNMIAGPGDVIYGVTAGDEYPLYVAIPLAGDRAGQVVMSTRSFINFDADLPPGTLINTDQGIYDLGSEGEGWVTSHVDPTGRPVTVPGLPTGSLSFDGDTVIEHGAAGRTWRIDIVRHPAFVPPPGREMPPARAAAGAAVFPAFLGPPAADGSGPTLPVVAVLRADGSVEWFSVSQGWEYAASDVWGTIFVRNNSDEGTIDVARLDEVVLTGSGAASSPAPPPAQAQSPFCDGYVTHENDYPIRRCHKGIAVVAIQQQLVARGYGIEIDGYYGSDTEQAVLEFQSRYGLAVDGLVGPDTWTALYTGDPRGFDNNFNGVVEPWEIPLDPVSSEPTSADVVGASIDVGPNRQILADGVEVPGLSFLELVDVERASPGMFLGVVHVAGPGTEYLWFGFPHWFEGEFWFDVEESFDIGSTAGAVVTGDCTGADGRVGIVAVVSQGLGVRDAWLFDSDTHEITTLDPEFVVCT